MKALKQIIFLNSFVWLAITFSGCSEFNKVVKSNDNELKRVKAVEYYEQGEYLKSVTLLE